MGVICFSECPACSRHLRCGERSCPFCGANVTSLMRVLDYRMKTPLNRARLSSVGVALAAAGFVVNCDLQPNPVYGAACCFSGTAGTVATAGQGNAGTGGAAGTGGIAATGGIGTAGNAPFAGAGGTLANSGTAGEAGESSQGGNAAEGGATGESGAGGQADGTDGGVGGAH